ncbi:MULTISPECIES: roadblock/LC7 domain-containing protein [unclassified Isoptericola]|uniref:roadblock/LC7 domain-containing protein n=1 Tax=Isoptericola sp. NPDC057191 TaxID=3346041 RepID=UPI00362CD0D3
MASIDDALTELISHPGVVGAVFVDAESGMSLGTRSAGAIDIEQVAAVNSQAVRSSLQSMRALGIADDLDDLLITFTGQYHVARVIPLDGNQAIIAYVVLDRSRGNLALGRLKVAEVARQIVI